MQFFQGFPAGSLISRRSFLVSGSGYSLGGGYGPVVSSSDVAFSLVLLFCSDRVLCPDPFSSVVMRSGSYVGADPSLFKGCRLLFWFLRGGSVLARSVLY